LKKEGLLNKIKEEKVKFIRLQMSDINGMLKNVEIPSDELESALENGTMFDGSSIEGMVRINESDMYLKPDLNSLCIFPWTVEKGKVARLMCDIYTTEGKNFEGDPRFILKKVISEMKEAGYEAYAGPEPEFFLLPTDEKSKRPELKFLDDGGYFDLLPIDKGEETRKYIVEALEEMGINVEASHHEVAPSQHEIDFTYDKILNTADNIQTFKLVVRTMAVLRGLHATFMPKPFMGINGSGMHCNMSLFDEKGNNTFFDTNEKYQISNNLRYFVGGILKHIDAITTIANPTINSYKRIIPGYEAPTNVAWSVSNRSALIRIPAARGKQTRVELRSPDPSANPYLLFAVIFASGFKGIKEKTIPPTPIVENIFRMDEDKKNDLGIKKLPRTLREAIKALEKDDFIQGVLGNHLSKKFIELKKKECDLFDESVTDWEINKYLRIL
jgi:glutamine synthetase